MNVRQAFGSLTRDHWLLNLLMSSTLYGVSKGFFKRNPKWVIEYYKLLYVLDLSSLTSNSGFRISPISKGLCWELSGD